ncbi:hypothetical protein L207DRAFT_78961 [Hyaloscypha variabilis F]|uniref:Uncharacterized protein n=1 Tax=Hyaloscypha variabilis (strain UAMH 11265 / GT02V1 / F) TaxID=1149755 RepID=A0A2J6RGF7_HYAVF|nr:hypothetical protein L207DRAFT_78961 [Hyaloscypha variabilis F]
MQTHHAESPGRGVVAVMASRRVLRICWRCWARTLVEVSGRLFWAITVCGLRSAVSTRQGPFWWRRPRERDAIKSAHLRVALLFFFQTLANPQHYTTTIEHLKRHRTSRASFNLTTLSRLASLQGAFAVFRNEHC